MIAQKDGIARAARFLSKERYSHALAALDQLPVDTQQLPAALWMRGAALSGVNRHSEAVDALRAAMPHLNELDRARCAIDMALTLAKMAKLDEAAEQVRVCRQICDALGAAAELAICDFLDLFILQRKGLHHDYLKSYVQVSQNLLVLGKPEWRVYAHTQAAFSLRKLGHFGEARALADAILPEAARLALAYRQSQLWFTRAISHLLLNNYRGASHSLKKAEFFCLESGGQFLLADIVLAKGNLAESTGDTQAAIHFYSQSAQLHDRAGFNEGNAWALLNAGAIYYITGEIQNAGVYFQQAHELIKNQSGNDLEIQIHLRMGAIQATLGNDAEAESLFSKVLEQTDTSLWLKAEAACFFAYVCPDERFENALERAKTILGLCPPSIYLTVAQRVLGERLAEKHRWEEARPLLMSAVNGSRQWPQQNAMALIRLAECDLDELQHAPPGQNPAPDALKQIRQKLRKIKKQARLLPDVSARAALLEADVAQAQNNPAQALTHLKEAIRNLRVIRLSGDDPVLTSSLAATFDPVYWRGARLAHQLNDAESLVSFVEHRRAQWLTRALNARSPGPAPSTELDEVQRALRRLRNVTAARPTAEQLAALRAGMQETTRRYDQMDLSLMFAPAAQPQVSPLRRPIPVAGNAELRAAFNARFADGWTAITLEPVSADGSEWLLLRLTPREFSHHALTAGTVIRNLLQTLADGDARFRRRFFGARPQDNAELRRLSAWLGAGAWLDDAPSGPNPPTLLIADSGWLSRLPLVSLPVDEQRCLGDCAALRFAPSLNTAAMLCYAPADERDPARWHTLAVAPASFNGRHPDLPCSDAALAALGAVWPGGVVLANQAASLAGARALAQSGELARFDAIFFATHANSEPRHLRLSGLAMHDGEITFQEMLSWRLNAQLVCLLACDSSFNVSRGGEERLGIETALIASGAKTVLSSRWPVKDEAAPVFIRMFVRHYLACKNAARALALTQQELAAGDMSPSDIAAWRVTGVG